MTHSRQTRAHGRPSRRLAHLAAHLAELLADGFPSPPPFTRAELVRHALDDRETIGELAHAVNRLDHRVAELEASIGTTDHEASHA